MWGTYREDMPLEGEYDESPVPWVREQVALYERTGGHEGNTLRGRGLPAMRGRRARGDLHVLVNVMIPSRLTDDQRELLRRFEESANGDTYVMRDQHEGLFDRIRHVFRS
jgi:molecular chaperone DnaJ